MMERYLMTHSLLSSWLYAIQESPYEDATSTRDSFAEFLQVLRREPTQTTEAMQNGIDFEDLVTDIINGTYKPEETFVYDINGNPEIEPNSGELMVTYRYHKWFSSAQKVAAIVSGGQLQVRTKKDITVNGMNFLLYGRLDALKAGTIYDIKYSGSYERGKFFDSTQHPMYFELVPEANDFIYLISNGKEVYQEHYRRDEVADITVIVGDFVLWLTENGLLETYKQHWKAL